MTAKASTAEDTQGNPSHRGGRDAVTNMRAQKRINFMRRLYEQLGKNQSCLTQ
jgi:hypothetical protein